MHKSIIWLRQMAQVSTTISHDLKTIIIMKSNEEDPHQRATAFHFFTWKGGLKDKRDEQTSKRFFIPVSSTSILASDIINSCNRRRPKTETFKYSSPVFSKQTEHRNKWQNGVAHWFFLRGGCFSPAIPFSSVCVGSSGLANPNQASRSSPCRMCKHV